MRNAAGAGCSCRLWPGRSAAVHAAGSQAGGAASTSECWRGCTTGRLLNAPNDLAARLRPAAPVQIPDPGELRLERLVLPRVAV